MDSGSKTLLLNENHYMDAFSVFVSRSTEHQCTKSFIETVFPQLICSLGDGKSNINVLGIGSGTGELDLLMLSKIHSLHPKCVIVNNVVEPSEHQIQKYKERIANVLNLDKITFSWHKKTADEYLYEIDWKDATQEYDFIHMIQVVYYLDDLSAALKCFLNRLTPNGKLLIILNSGEGGWAELRDKCEASLDQHHVCNRYTSKELTQVLNALGAKYEKHEIRAELDITECFIEGNRNGEHLLDFVTEIHNFSKVVSPRVKDLILDTLKECSFISGGRVIFKNIVSAVIVSGRQL